MNQRDKKIQSKESKKAGLHRDQRGAVLAEFVVVLIPLLTVFFVFVQLSAIAAASLVVKHSAIVGARAAAVFANEKGNIPELKDKDGKAQIEEGVKSAMGPWRFRMNTTVDVVDRSSKDANNGPYKLVTVTVTARYRCDVPLGKAICPGGSKTLVDTKSMAHQGARYLPE